MDPTELGCGLDAFLWIVLMFELSRPKQKSREWLVNVHGC